MAERVQTSDGLIARQAGDDVIVRVRMRMRRASFERMTCREDGHNVQVSAGMIGLVPDAPDHLGGAVWTLVVWSSEPTWSATGELIPGNRASFQAMMEEAAEAEMDAADAARDRAEHEAEVGSLIGGEPYADADHYDRDQDWKES
jgi:hypothetical protein